MSRTYNFNKRVETILERAMPHRPNTGTIHSVDGETLSLKLEGSVSIIRNVRVIGDIATAAAGNIVDILWDGNRPVVLLGGKGGTAEQTIGSIAVDNKTLEKSYEGLRVKKRGIKALHLDFAPALEGHTHDDPLANAGWQVSEAGVLFNKDTYLHPGGDITLGLSPNIVRLSSGDPAYRLWAGASRGEAAPFSVDKDGKIKSTAGKIAGWNLGDFSFISDAGNAEINSKTPHIQLGGATYLEGAGFWVGKHGSVYRLRIGNDQSFLKWTGANLEIQGNMQSADYLTGQSGWRIGYDGLAEFRSGIIGGWNVQANALEADNGSVKLDAQTPSISVGADGYINGSGFWVGKHSGVHKMFVGNEETYLAWDGNSLMIAADFRSTNYIPRLSGWAAMPSGEAEFQNVLIRGSIKARSLNMTRSSLLMAA